MNKVEIGPGNKRIDNSWVTLGPYEADNIDIVVRWGIDSLPFKDNSIDLIYASHVLEHIWWYRSLDALKEAYRVLKKDACLELHVPDFEKLVHCYLNKHCGDSWRKFNDDDDFMTWLNGRIFTYGGPGNIHRAVFDERYLKKLLSLAGFSSILNGAPIRGHDHGYINLSLTGVK